jgi:hypothetical protein
MSTYNLQVKDKVTGEEISLAKIFLLRTENGEPIQVNGVPAAFETDINGKYTLSAQPPLFIKAQATGYVSKNFTLQPGDNILLLDGVTVGTVSVQAARTFFNKYKLFIFLSLAMLMIFVAVKFKILK